MAIKILVTGDLHLGKRSSSIDADDVKISVKYTWEQIVNHVLSKGIEIVLLTGDIVDQDNRFYEAIGPLQSGLDKLSQAGVCVCMVAGNHDHNVLPQIISMSKHPNVHLLGANGKWESLVYSNENGESVRILGWSFTERYIYNSAVGSDFPLYNDGLPALALVHGDTYQTVSKYNPLNSEKLKQIANIDAWLLGHIHKQDIICDANPLIIYPGSPHALHPGEKDIHGVWQLTVENRSIDYKFLPLSPVCYQTLTIDVTEITNELEFRTKVVSVFNTNLSEIKNTYVPDYLVYDIELAGTCADQHEMRKWGNEIKNYTFDDWCLVVIRSVGYNILPETDIEHLIHESSYVGVLATAIKKLESGSSNAFTDKLIAGWKNRYQQVISIPVYNTLHADMPEDQLDALAREFIVKECRELIGELNLQRNEN